MSCPYPILIRWLRAAAVLLFVLRATSSAHADRNLVQLAADARQELAAAKAALVKDESLLNEAQAQPAGPDREQLIAIGTQTVEQQRLVVSKAQERLDALLGCTALKAQLDLDERTLKQQRKSIEAGLQELDVWTQENDKAQRAALEGARSFYRDATIGLFVETFGEQIDKLKVIQHVPIDRFDRQSLEDVAALRTKIDTLKGFRDLLLVEQGRRGVVDLWNQLHETSTKAHLTSIEIRDLTRRLAGNRVVQESVKQAALFAAANDFEKRMLKTHFPLVRHAIELGNFLVDYSYEATRFLESRKRILQQHKLSEREIEAVASVSCQHERTMYRLEQCRGVSIPAPSPSCERRGK